MVNDLLVFDPDGPGPIGERVLVSGSFGVAGTVFAQNLAVYDPGTRTWAPFGIGPFPANLQLAQATNGDIYVGGNFVSIAGVSAEKVARWDGTAWHPLGAGVAGNIWSLEALPTGGIVVCGQLSAAGGTPTAGIARWDGSAWSSLASTSLGIFDARTAVGMPNGDICAGLQLSSWSSPFVMRFDGTAWSPLGPVTYGPAQALLALPNGELIAGGTSIPGSTIDYVARWTGTTWVALPGAPVSMPSRFRSLPNGSLAACGRIGSSSVCRTAVWDGLAWTTLGDSSYGYGSLPEMVTMSSGELLVGGDFGSMAGTMVRSLARWNGSNWSAASPGLAGSMRSLVVRPDGSIFTGAAWGALNQALVHRWTGLGWSTIGGGYPASDTSNLTALFAASDGTLVSGGQAGWSGSTPAPLVQRWNGTTWTTIATATGGTIRAIAEMPNHDLVVGGQITSLSGVALNNVGRFDGSVWTQLGAGLPATVVKLGTSPTGDLYAATSTSVFRWTGATWQQIGLAQVGILALAVGHDGTLSIGGNFNGADVLRWNGSSWSPLANGPAGPVQSLIAHPDGSLVAGPLVDGSNPARPIERWNGAGWTALGSSVDGTVHAMAIGLNGDVLLAGDFSSANGAPRCHFARISTDCPATVQSLPASCYYPYSPPFVPKMLPWLGGVCRSAATSLPNDSLAIVVSGVGAAATPLTNLVAVAQTGCMLLVAPDVLQVQIPLAGAVECSFPVPNNPALLAAVVRQQVLPVGLDLGGNLTSVRASNALVYQVGAF